MNQDDDLLQKRFLQALTTVYKEGRHLLYSHKLLASREIDTEWVTQLDQAPMAAVELDAFVARFGRMQDTIGEELLPRWLQLLAETPGSQLDVLNRAERLGVLEDASEWIKVRRMRNLLIHEYMEDPRQFAEAIREALAAVTMLVETYNRIRQYSADRLDLAATLFPPALPSNTEST